MKSYTDVEQSKKLAEILPLDSADMNYATWTILDSEFIVSPNQGSTIKSLQEDYGNQIIPCWSLAALLEILPDKIVDDNGYNILINIEKYDSKYQVSYFTDLNFSDRIKTDEYENLVDTCVEMIVKLKEKDLL